MEGGDEERAVSSVGRGGECGASRRVGSGERGPWRCVMGRAHARLTSNERTERCTLTPPPAGRCCCQLPLLPRPLLLLLRLTVSYPRPILSPSPLSHILGARERMRRMGASAFTWGGCVCARLCAWSVQARGVRGA